MEENIAAVIDESAVVDESVAVSEEVAPQKKQRKPINQQKLQDNLWGWIFCIPLIVGTVWFVYSALVMALMLSFTNYAIGANGSGKLTEYLAQYAQHFGDFSYTSRTEGKVEIYDPLFWYSQIFTATIHPSTILPDAIMNEMGAYLFNTVFYMIGIPIGMVLSMFFAVCMSRDIKGGNVFRVLYYIPCVASTISIVYTFKIMFNADGVMNSLFGSDLAWLGSKNYTWNTLTGASSDSLFMNSEYWCQGIITKTVIVIMSVWKGLGGTIILYVAGLSGVNAATKEAAQIDGANGWQIFWKVTMPDLYPVIFYNIVTSVIGGLQIYAEPVLLIGENANTSGYVSLIWQYGLEGTTTHPSAGAAYGMFLAVIILVLTLFQFWLDGRKKD